MLGLGDGFKETKGGLNTSGMVLHSWSDKETVTLGQIGLRAHETKPVHSLSPTEGESEDLQYIIHDSLFPELNLYISGL